MACEVDQLGTILEGVHGSIPYNSFGKILLAAGLNYPASLGGNCVYQCRELVRKMLEEGYDSNDISYTTALERPHWVVLYQGEDARYLLDPFVYQKQLINVDLLLEMGSQVVSAYPLVAGEWSQLESKVDGPNSFVTDLQVPRLSGERKRALTYHYDLNNLQTELPANDYQLLAAQFQRELVLTYRDGVTLKRMYMDPTSGEMRIFTSDEGKVQERYNPRGFRDKFVDMALHCEVPPDELRHIFKTARGYYNRLKTANALVGTQSTTSTSVKCE